MAGLWKPIFLLLILLTSLIHGASDVSVSRAISPACGQVVDVITHASKTLCRTRVQFAITNTRDTAITTLTLNQSLPASYAGSQASLPPICTMADLLVSCTLSNIGAGASERLAFELGSWANISESEWPAPAVSARPILARLKAPAEAELGGDVVLELRAVDGTPLGGVRIEVQGPESTFTLVTNAAGLASFRASGEGLYAYVVKDEDISFSGQLATKVIIPHAPFVVTAALRKDLPPEANKIVDLLPLFLAFALLVLVALVWGFYFYATRPREEPVLPPQPPLPKPGTEPSPRLSSEPVQTEFEKAKDAAEATPSAEPKPETQTTKEEDEEEKKPPEKRLPSVFRPEKRISRKPSGKVGRPRKK
ncbi:MAG: hypothetical protein QXG98_00180 [Candidatus Micrarchaeia archaeon]